MVNMSIIKQMSNWNAILTFSGYFFSYLRPCFIGTESIHNVSACFGGFYLGGAYVRGVCIEDVCIEDWILLDYGKKKAYLYTTTLIIVIVTIVYISYIACIWYIT